MDWLAILVQIKGKTVAFKNFIRDMLVFFHVMIKHCKFLYIKILVSVPLLASIYHGKKIWPCLGLKVYESFCEEALLYTTRMSTMEKAESRQTKASQQLAGFCRPSAMI
jgi:hypothetical protein